MATSRPNLIARILGLALVVGACIYLLTCQPKPPPLPEPVTVRPAKTIVVESIDETTARSYTGVVKASELVDLSFRVSGQLLELPIRRGQEMEAGALIGQLDPRDFQTRLARISSQLEQAQAKLKAMKAGEREEVIRVRESERAAAQADLENAEIELARIQKLFDEQIVSQSELDQVRLRMDIATEKVGAAEERLREARQGARPEAIEAQEATVRGLRAQQQTAEDALSDTTLKAPFAGVVARQFAENFQSVTAEQPIISLQNISAIEIVADVPEAIVALLKREYVEALTVRFEALGQRSFAVEFEEIETEADPLTQTYPVTVTMPAPEDVNILPGMAATLHVATSPEFMGSSGTLVPATAIFSAPDGSPQVWKVDPDVLTISLVPVRVGVLSGDQIVVEEGLGHGDEIVTAGVHLLREGMTIRRFRPER